MATPARPKVGLPLRPDHGPTLHPGEGPSEPTLDWRSLGTPGLFPSLSLRQTRPKASLCVAPQRFCLSQARSRKTSVASQHGEGNCRSTSRPPAAPGEYAVDFTFDDRATATQRYADRAEAEFAARDRLGDPTPIVAGPLGSCVVARANWQRPRPIALRCNDARQLAFARTLIRHRPAEYLERERMFHDWSENRGADADGY